MKRLLVCAALATAVAVAIPGAALARHDGGWHDGDRHDGDRDIRRQIAPDGA
jgi:hypothetical protein